MKPVGLASCLQYARTGCDSLLRESEENNAEIDNIFIKAYGSSSSCNDYGIKFIVSFCDIKREFCTGTYGFEYQLKMKIDKQLKRIKEELI